VAAGGANEGPQGDFVAVVVDAAPELVERQELVNVEDESGRVTDEEEEDDEEEDDCLLRLVGLLLRRGEAPAEPLRARRRHRSRRRRSGRRCLSRWSSRGGVGTRRSVDHLPSPLNYPVDAVIEDREKGEGNDALNEESGDVHVENDIAVVESESGGRGHSVVDDDGFVGLLVQDLVALDDELHLRKWNIE